MAVPTEGAQAVLAAAIGEAALAAVVVAAAVEEPRLGEEHLDLAQLLLLEPDHVELVSRLDLARGELLGHVDPQHSDALVRVRVGGLGMEGWVRVLELGCWGVRVLGLRSGLGC